MASSSSSNGSFFGRRSCVVRPIVAPRQGVKINYIISRNAAASARREISMENSTAGLFLRAIRTLCITPARCVKVTVSARLTALAMRFTSVYSYLCRVAHVVRRDRFYRECERPVPGEQRRLLVRRDRTVTYLQGYTRESRDGAIREHAVLLSKIRNEEYCRFLGRPITSDSRSRPCRNSSICEIPVLSR